MQRAFYESYAPRAVAHVGRRSGQTQASNLVREARRMVEEAERPRLTVTAVDTAAGTITVEADPAVPPGEIHVGENARNFAVGMEVGGDTVRARMRSYANLVVNAPVAFPRGGLRDDDEDDETTEEVAAPAPPVNPVGGSGADQGRDAWVTPEWLADVVSGDYELDVDPCSNPRSFVLAKHSVSLETGGDGLFGRAGQFRADGETWDCTSKDRVFINPPYARGQVQRWVEHYARTDFIFLLRWAPDTEWFGLLWPKCWGAWFPKKCEVNPTGRINFVPPPGVTSSSNPFPHALYLKTKPSGKFLDRLLATGYLVTNDARQVEARPDSGVVPAAPAAAGGGRGNGGGAGRSAFAGVDRTAAPRGLAWAVPADLYQEREQLRAAAPPRASPRRIEPAECAPGARCYLCIENNNNITWDPSAGGAAGPEPPRRR